MHLNPSTLTPTLAKIRVIGPVGLLLLLICLAVPCVVADDSVTIPRSRLQELERKEAELTRLKSGEAKPKPEQGTTAPIATSVVATNSVSSASLPTAATGQSLPPLVVGEIVQAVDLAAQYAANVTAADQRYRKHKFQVEGEIAGFEKPMFTRNYNILLKTQGPRVVCDFYPPDQYGMVFTVKHGSELVGTLGDQKARQVTLAKVGQKVMIEGQCSGGDTAAIKLSRCTVKSVRD
jgi:hypothetical protein